MSNYSSAQFDQYSFQENSSDETPAKKRRVKQENKSRKGGRNSTRDYLNETF